jgi:GAF domain-containing protein
MIPQILPPADPADLIAALNNIADSAKQGFAADICFVLAINPITQWIIEPSDDQLDSLEGVEYSLLVETVPKTLEHGVHIFNVSPTQPDSQYGAKQSPRISTLVSIAVRTLRHNKPLAALFLGFREPRLVEEGELARLREFGNRSGLVLKTTWLLRRYREVVSLGQKISHDLESPEILFRKLEEEVYDILDTSHFFMLAVHQPSTDTLDMYMSEKGQYKSDIGSALGGGCAWVMKEKRPLIIHHLSEEAAKLPVKFEYIPGTDVTPPGSGVYVPLLLRDTPLGALTVQHPATEVYDEEDRQILELIGNQVALALDNLRLFDYLRGVNNTGQELTRQLSSERILQDVVDRICSTTKADIVVLYSYQGNEEPPKRFILPPYQSGQFIEPSFPKLGNVEPDDIALLVLAEGEPIFEREAAELYRNLGGDPGKRKGAFEQREKISSTAALPMRVDGETVGILFVNFRHPQRFDAPQKNLILSLANFAATAIRNSRRLEAAVQRRVEDLERLRRIDREISKSLNLNQVLQNILQEAHTVIRADDSAIALFDVSAQALKVEASIGTSAARRINQVIPLAREKGMALCAYWSKKPARSGNVHHDPEWSDHYFPFSGATISEIDVPLLYEDEAIGVLNFECARKDAFSIDDEKFIEALASQAVIAVRNAQTYERAQRFADELSALQEVGYEIVSKLSLDEVLDTIIEKALQITRSAAGLILLYDEKRNELYSVRDKGVIAGMENARIPEGQGIVWEVMKRKGPVRVNANDPLWKEKFLPFIPNVSWEVAVPIPDGDRIRGVINIESLENNPLTERDEVLLERLAALTSIAMQNAEQYQKAEKRRDRLEALRKVDQQIISQQGDSERVIEAILASASRLTDAEIAGLHLYEEGLPSKTYISKQGETGKIEPHTREKMDISEGIVHHVATTKEPYLTGDAKSDPLYRGAPAIKSGVAVPLLSDHQLIGVLNLESRKPDAFDEEDKEILGMLAGQAVITILNTRNFSEAKEQSARFHLLTEAGEELSRITDLEKIGQAYDIVLHKIMDHNEGQVVIRRFDPYKNDLCLVRVERKRGVDPRDRIKLSEGINGQAARERRTIHVADRDRLPEGTVEPIYDSSIKTLVIAPILVEDEYYGNLVALHEDPGYFNPSDIRLLEGLAKQLALTIHRVESLEARKQAEERAKQNELFSEIGQSAYEVTHRLGNDLGLVKTYINRIRQILEAATIPAPKIEEQLEKIVSDVSRVLSMGRGLKNKVADIGKKSPPPETLPVLELIGNIWHALQGRPDNIELLWDAAGAYGNVHVVMGQIIEIMNTLVANSIEAMPDGGLIRVCSLTLKNAIHIEVSDTGPGISPKNRDKIFNLFFSTKESSGFGLWSARRYARANGGELVFGENSLTKGATFILTLPVI